MQIFIAKLFLFFTDKHNKKYLAITHFEIKLIQKIKDVNNN